MFQELDQLITEEINCLHENVDIFNGILIDLSKCKKNDQINQIFSSIEKTQNDFNKKINDIQNTIKNFIKIYKSKVMNFNSSYRNISYQQQNYPPILGIDLGTSNSTVGYYRLNTRKRGEMNIVANFEGTKSIPSVVCISDKKITVGKEAIKMSNKNSKNFIYDSKRMLGKKFNDPIIQEYRKNWTFETVQSKTGGILIKVDDKYYEPYEISGMILIELMNLANSQLNDQTNQAIITIPAYFTDEQIKDTKRAAKYANIELIDLLKEPLAATFCYGYKTNDILTSKKSRDILIYDFGGGTLDVSYVEVKGSEFNVLAAEGDSDLGGQDFTNCIFKMITPKLDALCNIGWQNKPQFVNKVKKYCEDAKIKLSSVEEYEMYFDIPKDIGKKRDSILEQIITRNEFKKVTKHLFDRCMNPVMKVLQKVKRNPHKIESLVLVGGSSYLPMILDKLYELTGKDAYHGVSAVDAVSFGACIYAGQYIQQKLIEANERNTQIDSHDEYLLNMKVNNQTNQMHQTNENEDIFVTSTIGVVKYDKKIEYYEDVITEGNPLPYTKEVLIHNTDVLTDPNDKYNIKIPIFIYKNESRQIIHQITYSLLTTNISKQRTPILKIELTQNKSGIFYSYRRTDEIKYSSKKQIPYSIESLYSTNDGDSNIRHQKNDQKTGNNENDHSNKEQSANKEPQNRQTNDESDHNTRENSVNKESQNNKQQNDALPNKNGKDNEIQSDKQQNDALLNKKDKDNETQSDKQQNGQGKDDEHKIETSSDNQNQRNVKPIETFPDNTSKVVLNNSQTNVTSSNNVGQNNKSVHTSIPIITQPQVTVNTYNKILRDIKIIRYSSKERKQIEIAKFTKGTNLPCLCEVVLTGLDVNLMHSMQQIHVPIYIYKSGTHNIRLPDIVINISEEEKKTSKTKELIDIKFEIDSTGNFKCGYKNRIKQYYFPMKFTANVQKDVNNFIFN